MFLILPESDIVDLTMFRNDAAGDLVAIRGTDPALGPWSHRTFVPKTLGAEMPALSAATYLRVADARAALAALDNTGQQLPDAALLRSPTPRTEAQSTSALEGTYAPLGEVLVAYEDEPGSVDLREILNYVRMANYGFDWVGEGRPISTAFLCDLNALLMRGIPLAEVSGRLRDEQVVIGRRADADLAPGSRSTRLASCPHRPAPRSRPGWATWWTGCESTTPAGSTRWSRRPWRTTSSRPSTRSATATAGWAGCLSSSTCSRWEYSTSRR